jgi:hypothetical protein
MMKEQKSKEEKEEAVSLLSPHFRLLSSSLEKADKMTTTRQTTASLRQRRQLQDFDAYGGDDEAAAGDDVSYLGDDENYDPSCDGRSYCIIFFTVNDPFYWRDTWLELFFFFARTKL